MDRLIPGLPLIFCTTPRNRIGRCVRAWSKLKARTWAALVKTSGGLSPRAPADPRKSPIKKTPKEILKK